MSRKETHAQFCLLLSGAHGKFSTPPSSGLYTPAALKDPEMSVALRFWDLAGWKNLFRRAGDEITPVLNRRVKFLHDFLADISPLLKLMQYCVTDSYVYVGKTWQSQVPQ